MVRTTRSAARNSALQNTKKDEDVVDNDDQADVTSDTASPKKAKAKRNVSPRKTKKVKGSSAEASLSDDSDSNSSAGEREAAKRSKSSSPRKAKKKAAVAQDFSDSSVSGDEKETPKKRKRSPSKTSKLKGKKAAAKSEEKLPKKKKASKKAKASSSSDEDSVAKKKKSPARKAADHQRQTEQDEIPKLWDEEKAKANGSYTFKIATWNVAGLRALLRKAPNALSDLVQKHDLDMLCLQETKLQQSHVDDPKLKIGGHLLVNEGYDAYYSCSTAKKGYSGTAVFVKQRGAKKKGGNIKDFFASKKKTSGQEEDELPVSADFLIPTDVSYKMGKEEHDAEGRVIMLDFPLFSICNLYVPNSGQKLERLDYRTEQWDKDLLEFIKNKQSRRGVPVMWLGDLNVAHTNLEVWNDGAKHLAKQAGVTEQERASFQAQLDSGFVDAFRRLHPEAKGHYSYWSQRSGNREPNKGLRLDYFICDPSFFDESSKVVVRDSYMIKEQEGSDHCPAVLEIEIKA